MSTDPALSLPDKDSLADKEAEIACLNGRAKKLSAYFKRQERPTANVVYSIARALMATAENPGPGNRKLVCSTRTGRPPKSQPCPTDAAQALATGHAVAAGLYLMANPEIDGAIQRALAEALDPIGDSKWKLTFERPRKGNPRSDLRTAINQAIIDDTAKTVRAQAKAEGSEANWCTVYPKAQRKLERHFNIKARKSTIRASRAAAKRARGKNPPV